MSIPQQDRFSQEGRGVPEGWHNTRLYLCGGGGYEAVRSEGHVWRAEGSPTAPHERELGGGGVPPSPEENRRRSVRRSIARVRRLVRTNGLRYLWSLTFVENLQDVAEADKAFWALSRVLVARGVPWLAVRERQKRGAVHYHLAVDRFIPHSAMAKWWGRGFVFVTGPRQGWRPSLAARYLTKYLAKAYLGESAEGAAPAAEPFEGHHRYLRATGLAVAEVVDTFTRSVEEFLQLVGAVADVKGWTQDYLKVSDQFQSSGGGP